MNQTNPNWIDGLEPPVALVFGGGASLGASQVGMVRALMEAGVRPDLIVGTSVGALNGSFLARQFDSDQVDKLEAIWREITRDRVFPGVSLFRLVRMLTGGERYLASNKGIRRLVDQYLPETHRELEIPTTTVASDLVNGEKVSLDEGDLRTHVTISASIPFIFEPVEHEGRTLVDGGVTANVPVLPARQAGANSMVVLDPGYPCALDDIATDLLGFSLHIVTLMIRHQSYGVLHFLSDDCPVVYIPPPCPIDVAPHEFDRAGELIDAGYRHASEFLEDLSVDGPGIYGHPHFHGDELEVIAGK